MLKIIYFGHTKCELMDSPPSMTILCPVQKVFTTVRNNNGKYEEVETDSKQVCLGMSVGEALSNIAAFLGGNFIIDGDNNIKLVKKYIVFDGQVGTVP